MKPLLLGLATDTCSGMSDHELLGFILHPNDNFDHLTPKGELKNHT
jgi:hypothetical protein